MQTELRYGNSQTVLVNLALSQQGDLFLPGDELFIQLAQEKGLIDEVLPLARMSAVVVVRKGNPLGIKAWQDLLREDVRLGQANPDAAAIGKLNCALGAVTKETFIQSGTYAAVRENIVVHSPTAT